MRGAFEQLAAFFVQYAMPIQGAVAELGVATTLTIQLDPPSRSDALGYGSTAFRSGPGTVEN